MARRERAALVFDLDGVLVDPRPGIVACVNGALASFGIAPFAARAIERVIGPPLAEGFALLLRERDADPALAAPCVLRYREAYETASLGGGTLLVPGIAELVAALAPRVRLAVATSKPVRFAEPILRELGIRDAFAVVTGPTPETDGEAKAATLARALAELGGVDAARSLMIGDRRHDVAAALALGLVPVGVTWGFGSEAELREAGATAIARDVAALGAYAAAAFDAA
jgi:phosphoglycolate phosphatase